MNKIILNKHSHGTVSKHQKCFQDKVFRNILATKLSFFLYDYRDVHI